MAASLLQRLGCCLTGHDYSIASDSTRMFVRCNRCGHTSRGLSLTGDPLRRRPRAEGGTMAVAPRQAGISRLATR